MNGYMKVVSVLPHIATVYRCHVIGYLYGQHINIHTLNDWLCIYLLARQINLMELMRDLIAASAHMDRIALARVAFDNRLKDLCRELFLLAMAGIGQAYHPKVIADLGPEAAGYLLSMPEYCEQLVSK
jgi:hypothetical protein